MDANANIITLVDDDGNEKDYEILLTFESDDTQKKYVFYYDASINEEEIEVYVSSYDDDNNIYQLEDEKELEMVEEVYNTFVEEEGLGEEGSDVDE